MKAVVLREKWIEENGRKTKDDWDPKIHLKEMQKKYDVQWKETKHPTLSKFLVKKPAGNRVGRVPINPLAGKDSIEVDFMICVSDTYKSSLHVT